MAFHLNGYSNFHDDNQDWIVSKIKSIEDTEAHTEELAEAAQNSANASQASAEAASLSAEASQASAEAAQLSAEASANSATSSQESAQNAANIVSDTMNAINVLQGRVDNIIPSGTQTEGNTELIDIRTAENGAIFDSAGDAVRGQIENIRTDFEPMFYTSKQMFPKDKADIQGYFAEVTNVFTPNNTVFGAFMPVKPGDEITFSGIGTCYTAFTKTASIAVNSITSQVVPSNTLPQTRTAPAGAAYLYVSCSASAKNTIMINKGTTAEPIENFVQYTIAENEKYETVYNSYQSDVIGRVKLTEGNEKGYYDAAGVFHSNTTFTAIHMNLTGLRPGMKQIEYTALQASQLPMVLWKVNGTLYGEFTAGDKVINVEDATEIFINFFGPSYTDEFILKYSPVIYEEDINDILDAHTCNYKNIVNKPFVFTQKKALFYGDSITAGYIDDGATTTPNGYPKLFSERVGMGTYYNMGIGGSTYSNVQTEVSTILNTIQNTQNLDTFDYIFVAAGVNDWQLGCTLADFETAVINTFDYLKTNAAGEVVIIAPIKTGYHNDEVAPLSEFRNVLAKQALLHEFNFVNGGDFDFDTSGPLASYLFGGSMILHPSEAGYRQLTKGLLTAVI